MKISAIAATLAVAISSAATFAGVADANAVTLTLGHKTAVDSTFDRQAQKFKELVESRTDGEVTIKIFPANQLGKQREQLEGVSVGSQDMFLEAVSTLSTFKEDMRFFGTPFVFDTVEQVVENEDFQRLLDEVREENNVRVLSVKGTRPPFQVWTRSEPIRSLDDLQGMKIRSVPTKAQVDVWNGLGATAVAVPWSEVYVALSQGVVDGMVHNVVQVVEENFHEQLRYVAKIDGPFASATNALFINETKFQSLSPEQQEIVSEAAIESGEYFQSLVDTELSEAWDTVRKAGIEVIEVDSQPWLEKARDIHQQMEDSGTWSKGLLEKTVKQN